MERPTTVGNGPEKGSVGQSVAGEDARASSTADGVVSEALVQVPERGLAEHAVSDGRPVFEGHVVGVPRRLTSETPPGSASFSETHVRGGGRPEFGRSQHYEQWGGTGSDALVAGTETYAVSLPWGPEQRFELVEPSAVSTHLSVTSCFR